MNLLDLVPRWVWAVVVASLAATLFLLKLENADLSIKVEEGKTNVAQLEKSISEASTAAAKKATELETQARQAEAAAAVRERTLRADIARGRSELDGLRSAASSYSMRTKPNPLGSGLDVADIFPELFLSCSGRLVEVAGEADQWKSDAIKLYEAWPRQP